METLPKVHSLVKKSMKGMESQPGRKGGQAGGTRRRGQEVWVEGVPLPLVTLPRSLHLPGLRLVVLKNGRSWESKHMDACIPGHSNAV